MPLVTPPPSKRPFVRAASQPADETTRPVRVRAKRRSLLTGFIAVCLVALIASGFSFAADAAFDAPWAYSIPGGQTLTGTWEGAFTTPSGIRFALFLELHRPVLANGSPQMQDYRGALLAGEASWCDSQGRAASRLPVTGAVPAFTGFNGSADRVEIDLENGDDPQRGLVLLNLQGSWAGDTLTLKPMFATWNGSTYVYSGDNPDISGRITIVLKKVRYDAFPAACGTLKGAAP